MFGIALVVLCVVAWFVTAAALVVGPVLFLRGGASDTADVVMAAGGIALGVGMLLFGGALATGDIRFEGRPDGCYYAHTQLIGKTTIQRYDPIQCVGVDVPR